jgi:cell division protein FtsW (lipid II flippase)
MTIESAFSGIYSFLITNQMVTFGILVFLALLLWRKPLVFFKLTLALLSIIVVFYIMTLFSGSMVTGINDRNQMIHETGSKMSTD